MAKKSDTPSKKSAPMGDAIPQRKKLAMGMAVNTGGKAVTSGKKTPC